MLASWNVNSLRVRQDQVVDWLKTHNPDVLGLQETKTTDDQFPLNVFEGLGYHIHFTGQKTYNGVAMFSKEKPLEIIDALPGFEDEQKRFMAMAYPNCWVVVVYVPNGSEVGSAKYHYKLDWLDALIACLQHLHQDGREVVVMGDFNIAPYPIDVYDDTVWSDGILVSPDERDRTHRLFELGFVDVFRSLHKDEVGHYSWWDYRQARFRRGQGLRIDLLLATRGLADRVEKAWIDVEPRKHERPSDHAPVVAHFKGLCDEWA